MGLSTISALYAKSRSCWAMASGTGMVPAIMWYAAGMGPM
jgi:hypothetical protein